MSPVGNVVEFTDFINVAGSHTEVYQVYDFFFRKAIPPEL